MSCLGTIIGATIGMFLGGPLGAIAGAAFGSLASSRGQDKYSAQYGRRMNATEHAQMTFYVGAFSMLAKLSQADGEVTSEERAKVEEFMAQDLRLDENTKNSARQIFEAALGSRETFHGFANQFYREFRHRPQFFQLMIDIMLRVATADQAGLTSPEESLIQDAVHIFRLPEGSYQNMKARYVRRATSAYAVLGCSPEDSAETIKRAYRRLVSEYHPDKIAHRGLPEEFQQLASEKFREIQNAYDSIRKERGTL